MKGDPSIGKRIKSALRDKNMSQADLARAADISSSNLSGYVSGSKMPNLQTLARIAKALSASLDFLYFGKDASGATRASSDGEGIVEALLFLKQKGVLIQTEWFKQSGSVIPVSAYADEIVRLFDAVDDFNRRRNSFPNPDEYYKQMTGAIANEIDQEISDTLYNKDIPF